MVSKSQSQGRTLIGTCICIQSIRSLKSKCLFLPLLNIALLVVGALMEIFATQVVVPMLKPLAAYSLNPVQMGVIFIANLELGHLHPPVGINLFLSAYRFKKPMGTIIWATLPFLLILAATVLLITYVPWLTTAPLHWLGKQQLLVGLAFWNIEPFALARPGRQVNLALFGGEINFVLTRRQAVKYESAIRLCSRVQRTPIGA